MLIIKQRVLFVVITAILIGGFAFPHYLFADQLSENVAHIFGLRDQELASCWMINVDSVSQSTVQTLPEIPTRPARKVVRLTATAYSSSYDETDSDPYTTASGSRVRDGIVAYNYLPFGTKVRFPEVYGDKVFTVEDRIGRGGRYLVDMWKSSKAEAKAWGAKIVRMEIL